MIFICDQIIIRSSVVGMKVQIRYSFSTSLSHWFEFTTFLVRFVFLATNGKTLTPLNTNARKGNLFVYLYAIMKAVYQTNGTGFWFWTWISYVANSTRLGVSGRKPDSLDWHWKSLLDIVDDYFYIFDQILVMKNNKKKIDGFTFYQMMPVSCSRSYSQDLFLLPEYI